MIRYAAENTVSYSRRLRQGMSPGRELAASYSSMKVFLRIGSAVLLFLVLVSPPFYTALAQGAIDTAHQNMHVEAFGMGTYYRPNYFNTGDSAYGVTGGMSLDLRVKFIRPGLEARGSYTTYPFMSQKLISAGPRVTFDAGRFHPYGNFLVGYGDASFKQYTGSYRGNNSTVYSYGGGLDYSLTRSWAVRADYQHQGWDFDAPIAPFNPQAVSVGARYLLHFPSRRGPS